MSQVRSSLRSVTDSMDANLLSRRTEVIVVTMCALLIIVAGSANLLAQKKLESSRAWVAQAKTVQLAIATTLNLVHQARADVRTYLLTTREESRTSFEGNRAELSKAAGELQALVSDNPEQQARARALGEGIRTTVAVYERELAGTVDPDRTTGPWLDVKAAADDMSTAEEALLGERLRTLESVAARGRLALSGTVALGLVLLCVVAWLIKRLNAAGQRARAESVSARQRLMAAALQEKAAGFELLADNMSPLAWIAASDGSIHWYNKRWREFTGTEAGSLLGWNWTEVLHPDHLERVLANFRRAIHDEEAWEDSFPLRAADGSYRWFLSRAIPWRDEHGKVLRWFGTNTDITAQKQPCA